MTTELVRDPAHWRARAKEARDVAVLIADPESRRRMFGIADEYEKLAERAVIRAKGPPQSK
jgi:hypothetical protein